MKIGGEVVVGAKVKKRSRRKEGETVYFWDGKASWVWLSNNSRRAIRRAV